jgi:colicin import membrane protein
LSCREARRYDLTGKKTRERERERRERDNERETERKRERERDTHTYTERERERERETVRKWNRGSLSPSISQVVGLSSDEEYLDKTDEYEKKINFRFEEEGASEVCCSAHPCQR